MPTLSEALLLVVAYEGDRPQDTPATHDGQPAARDTEAHTPEPDQAPSGFLLALLRALAAWGC